jgi:N-acylneuraminate cytidylyltransferase
MGLKIIKEAGIDVLCISSELNPVVAVRCCKLGIRFMAGIRHKAQTLAKIMPTHNHHWATTAYIGNDVNDLDCIKKAALSFCPYDAPNDIREEVDFITDADHKAGSGAVRQVCEFLLQARVKLTQ